MVVEKINKHNFENEILNNKGMVLVDFYADWCGPCKMIAPNVSKVAEERTDILVGKVNIDESPELAAQFGVMSIPTLIVFQNGKQVSKSVGYRTQSEILAMLSQIKNRISN